MKRVLANPLGPDSRRSARKITRPEIEAALKRFGERGGIVQKLNPAKPPLSLDQISRIIGQPPEKKP